ncbi:MAG: hypothetical protein CMJ64_21530 [Planctomycetaceae bacterium]|jgi:hypothetical protein|nr:hypothetical protein [Planctomycetaceae bacterium]
MQQLESLLGREHEIDSLNRALRDFAQSQRADGVGAMHVTCSDESERESAESFQHWFCDNLLPELKFWSRSPFRQANLGGRYEFGATAIAEQHFATPKTRDGFKLLLVKINSHVAVHGGHGTPTFGIMPRYEVESTFCGGLHALLDGVSGPFIDDLAQTFASEGKPRLAMLRDPEQIDPSVRALLAAIVNARLQARRAIVDIQNHTPHTPTLYFVLSCVTLNRKQRDAELVVGYYLADRRDSSNVEYHGLGDDPSEYRFSLDHQRIVIEDDHVGQPRSARDHREHILSLWMERREPTAAKDARLIEVAQQATPEQLQDPKLAKEIAKTLGWILLDLSPIPTSVLLFAKGAAGAHHLYNVHRLARGEQDEGSARKIVSEFIDNVDSLSGEQARGVIDSLLEHHRKA